MPSKKKEFISKEDFALKAEYRRNSLFMTPEAWSVKIPSTQRLVLGLLASLGMRHDSGCTHTNDTLALKLDRSSTTVSEALTGLVRAGLVLRLYVQDTDGSFHRRLIPLTRRAERTFRILRDQFPDRLVIDQSCRSNLPKIQLGIAQFADRCEKHYGANLNALRKLAGLPHFSSDEAYAAYRGDTEKSVSGIPEKPDIIHSCLRDKIDDSPKIPARSGDLPNPFFSFSQTSLVVQSPTTDLPPSPVPVPDLAVAGDLSPASVDVPSVAVNESDSVQPSSHPGYRPPVTLEWPAKPHYQFRQLESEYPGFLAKFLAYFPDDNVKAFLASGAREARRLRRMLSNNVLSERILELLESFFNISQSGLNISEFIDRARDLLEDAASSLASENACDKTYISEVRNVEVDEAELSAEWRESDGLFIVKAREMLEIIDDLEAKKVPVEDIEMVTERVTLLKSEVFGHPSLVRYAYLSSGPSHTMCSAAGVMCKLMGRFQAQVFARCALNGHTVAQIYKCAELLGRDNFISRFGFPVDMLRLFAERWVQGRAAQLIERQREHGWLQDVMVGYFNKADMRSFGVDDMPVSVEKLAA